MAVGHEAPDEVLDGFRRRVLDPKTPLPAKYRALFALRNLKGAKAEASMVSGKHLLLGGCTSICVSMQMSNSAPSCMCAAAALQDPSALFRHEVAYCLGQRQDPAAIPTLQRILCDAHEHSM